jgi:polyisoprenoid-binding protein YceI
MKKLLTLAIAMLLFYNANDSIAKTIKMPAGVYQLDKSHASLIWKVSHLGLSDYTARFTSFDATVTLDPNDISQSEVSATIDPLSVKTDYPTPEKKDFDKVLATDEKWFNANVFPTIKFVSTAIVINDDNSGTLTGNLTFLGVTKPITLDVKLNGMLTKQPFSKLPTLGFSASGVVKRSDWGLDTYVPLIGDDVAIMLELEFAKQK